MITRRKSIDCGLLVDVRVSLIVLEKSMIDFSSLIVVEVILTRRSGMYKVYI